MATLPLIVAASVSVALPSQQSPRAPELRPVHPALWVVSDADTTIYLFGTFHALDGTTNWFTDEVKTAFDASGELVLETLLPEIPRASEEKVIPITARFAKRPPAAAIRQVTQVPPQASFLASTKVVMAASHARGMSSALGADAILREKAEAHGKPVGGLESFEYQLRMFDSLQTQAAPPPNPELMRNVSIALAQLQDAWNRGDTDAFAPMLEQMRSQTPASYQTMFVDRNGRWAHWIADRLKQPGVVFVAVGTGHLTGPDSVQNQLASLGISTGRINY